MKFDADSPGWLHGVEHLRSPNCDARPHGVAVDLLVIHYISLPAGRFSGDAVERLFTNRLDERAHPGFAELSQLRVSAHFFLRRRGSVTQFVGCEQRAWHAGVSRIGRRERCNDFSIGIELEGDEHHAFTQAQYRRLLSLIAVLRQRYPLRLIAGHSDIAPGRKFDPGPHFDWSRVLPQLQPMGISRPF